LATLEKEQGGCRIKSGMTMLRNLPAICDQDFGEHQARFLNSRSKSPTPTSHAAKPIPKVSNAFLSAVAAHSSNGAEHSNSVMPI
jgi:hypothetical protein